VDALQDVDIDIDILISESTFDELVSLLDRPKFDRCRELESWNSFAMALVELVLLHEDAGKGTGISRYVDDEKFLALAVSGQADVIISSDRDLLDLVPHKENPIPTPARLLWRLRDPEA
jgi:putative PIN family toxin of toxin-antitoxin system